MRHRVLNRGGGRLTFAADGNGMITVDELRSVMHSLNRRPTDEQIMEMIDKVSLLRATSTSFSSSPKIHLPHPPFTHNPPEVACESPV